ncbi:hypothetical protein RHMOL_Rhmol08G0143100 [Rhododendron molle]|uniref:Uncharacterized protein n=1 Tax=Rhododendron molle TaxID=49168 RepID=A0ACC0MNM8_RHOML|nr:hypothetical protein RHMOL_Rhmol08G0143100 [Rhododendron molle]
MQERFGIKFNDPGKLGLPDFDYFGKDDFVDFGEYLPKPRKALLEIQNLATVISEISDVKPVKHEQVIESPVSSLTSPTPPKIPFASMSLLQKRILQSDLRKDPFSALELSPARKFSSGELVDGPSGHHNRRKRFEL